MTNTSIDDEQTVIVIKSKHDEIGVVTCVNEYLDKHKGEFDIDSLSCDKDGFEIHITMKEYEGARNDALGIESGLEEENPGLFSFKVMDADVLQAPVTEAEKLSLSPSLG